MFGVTFIKKDGDPKSRQPLDSNPVWKEWEKWYKKRFSNDRN